MIKKLCKNLKAFTLLELLIVIIVMSIIIVIGGRSQAFSIDAKKYSETVEKLRIIKRALVGDERLVNRGTSADFGYFERYAAWPAGEGGSSNEVPTTALADYLPPMPKTSGYDYYKVDAWGNNFVYTPNTATFVSDDTTKYSGVQIISYGRDGASGASQTIFDIDTQILIRKDLYESNLVVMNVMDNIGNILRGYPWMHEGSGTNIDASAITTNHQIYRVQMLNVNNTVVLDTEIVLSSPANSACCFYSQGLFSNRFPLTSSPTYFNGIKCGIYKVRVYPTDPGLGGNSKYGAYDHTNDLAFDLQYVEQIVPIYPKDPLSPNFFEFRFSGKVDLREL